MAGPATAVARAAIDTYLPPFARAPIRKMRCGRALRAYLTHQLKLRGSEIDLNDDATTVRGRSTMRIKDKWLRSGEG